MLKGVIQESNTNRDNVVVNSAYTREEKPATPSEQKNEFDQDPFDYVDEAGLGFVKNGLHIQEFAAMVDRLDNTLVCWALYQTAGVSHPNWNYFKAVIQRAEDAGIKNADEAERQRQAHNRRASPRNGRVMRKEKLPDWAKNDQGQGQSSPDPGIAKASDDQLAESKRLLASLHSGGDPSE